jgi:hypothetical protein
MTAIRQWQRLAHELAREKGEHSLVCLECNGVPNGNNYELCRCRTGRVEVDHKSPTRISSRLALIHLAISRAVECAVKGEMTQGWQDDDGTHWGTNLPGALSLCSDPEPVGFPIALADVFLRLCDLAESIGVALPDVTPVGGLTRECVSTPEKLLSELNYLHYVLADWTNDPEDTTEEDRWGEGLTQVLFALRRLCSACGVDLFAMAELKYAYEKGRAK